MRTSREAQGLTPEPPADLPITAPMLRQSRSDCWAAVIPSSASAGASTGGGAANIDPLRRALGEEGADRFVSSVQRRGLEGPAMNSRQCSMIAVDARYIDMQGIMHER